MRADFLRTDGGLVRSHLSSIFGVANPLMKCQSRTGEEVAGVVRANAVPVPAE
jgi:hypothetical protein